VKKCEYKTSKKEEFKSQHINLIFHVLWTFISFHRRNLDVAWQTYPLGSGGIPLFNYDSYTFSPESETQADNVQKVFLTKSYLNPDP
jgi:hypothetical protein